MAKKLATQRIWFSIPTKRVIPIKPMLNSNLSTVVPKKRFVLLCGSKFLSPQWFMTTMIKAKITEKIIIPQTWLCINLSAPSNC